MGLSEDEGLEPVPCPVPQEWMVSGAPPEAIALFSEGFCPVHRCPLWPDMISRGGKGSLPRTWIEAGRCDQCCQGHGADWHLSVYWGKTLLTATWDASVKPGGWLWRTSSRGPGRGDESRQ